MDAEGLLSSQERMKHQDVLPGASRMDPDAGLNHPHTWCSHVDVYLSRMEDPGLGEEDASLPGD